MSINRNEWTSRKQPCPLTEMNGLRGSNRPPLCVGWFTPPRRPLISVNGHLVGHYPLHNSVPVMTTFMTVVSLEMLHLIV